MTCVSADARITPACPGLYAPEHTAAWKRIVDFVHANTDAKIGMQLGHAGAKGSTRAMWDGIDQPLDTGNWPLVSASEQQYLAGVSQLAREAGVDDMAASRTISCAPRWPPNTRASTGWSCTAPTATCCPPSFRR
jgi:anthraniloyl-CoA monooxygenase